MSWRAHIGPALTGLATLFLATAGAEALIRGGAIEAYLVPPPSEIIGAFGRLVTEEDVVARFLVTAGETLAADVLLALFGVSGGVILFRVPFLRRAYANWIGALAAAPVILAYPLFLVIFGRGSTTVVLIGFLAALPAVVLKTLEGLSAVKPVFARVGRSLNASEWQIFSKIVFPAAMPSIFVGIRLGLLFALLNIFGVEYLINTGGLGQMVNELSELYDLAGTYAGIGWVVLVSILVFTVTEALERSFRRAER
jgi:NitT/TauT family transport system permease protein